MSAHSKSQAVKTASPLPVAGIGLALAVFLMAAPPAQAETCHFRVEDLPPTVPLTYDSFSPSHAPATLKFRVSNPREEACQARLALVDSLDNTVSSWVPQHTNLKLELRPRSGVTRSSMPDQFDLSIAGGQSVEVEFDVVVLQESVVPAGTYIERLFLNLYQSDGAGTKEQIPVNLSLSSIPRAQLNISGSRGEFGAGGTISVVDFGPAETGKARHVYIQTRANAASRLSFKSANKGRLSLQDQGAEGSFLEYRASFDGQALDLANVTLKDIDLPFDYSGLAFELNLVLGNVAGARAGTYTDELTIEISTL